jgi:hypothetical protein
VRGGKIPEASSYSPSETAFVLGIARRTVNSWLDRGVLQGFKLASQGLTTWRWRVPYGSLARFLEAHPEFSYGRDRIRGRERNGDDRPGS